MNSVDAGAARFVLFCLAWFNHSCIVVFSIAQGICEIQADGFLLVGSGSLHE